MSQARAPSALPTVVLGVVAPVVIGALAAALVLIHPAVPLILGGAAVAVPLIMRPFPALSLFVAVLLTRPTDFFPAVGALQPAKALILLSLGTWFIKKVLQKDLTLARSSADRWMVALTLVALASSIVGSNPGESMALFKDVFLKIVLLYVLIQNLVDTPRRLVQFTYVLAGIGLFLGGYAFISKITGNATVEGSRAALVGLLGDPNDLALTLLMPCFVLMVAARERAGARRLGFALLALLVVFGIISTQSRGGLLGTAAGGYFLLRSVIKSRVVIFSMIGVALLGVVALSGMTERKSGAVGEGAIDESAQGRLDAWIAGGRMVMRRPVFGVGFGRFADNFEAYSINPVFWGKHETHNSYIKVAAETGIAGLTPFMALVVLTLLSGWRQFHRPREEDEPVDEYAARRTLLPMAVAVLVTAFFLSQCWSWVIYILFGTVCAADRIYRPAA